MCSSASAEFSSGLRSFGVSMTTRSLLSLKSSLRPLLSPPVRKWTGHCEVVVGVGYAFQWVRRMKRKRFVKVVEKALDSLPGEFRSRIRNVAVLVEDKPPNQPSARWGQQRRLVLGIFHGVPTTRKSIFDLPTGPDYIVLYQKNIEAVCSSEAEVREQIRLTVIHELGHYFGMDENQLKDV